MPHVSQIQRDTAKSQRDMEVPLYKAPGEKAEPQHPPPTSSYSQPQMQSPVQPRRPQISSPSPQISSSAIVPHTAPETTAVWNAGYGWSDTMLKYRQENPVNETSAPDFNRPIFHNAPKPGSIQIDIKPLTPDQRDPGKRLVDGVTMVTCVDFNIRNFHGYETKNGSTYGSYLIEDTHPTLIDTVKYPFAHQLLENIARVMPLDKLEYLVLNHAEPDHSSSTPYIVAACPNVTIVCNDKCKKAMQQIYVTEGWRWQVVSDGEVLDIGQRKLKFITVPLVHWPESMWTFDETQKVLYSNDGFGQHLATERLWDDEHSLDEIMAANRYDEYYRDDSFCFFSLIN